MSIDTNKIPYLLRQIADAHLGKIDAEILTTAADMCDSHLNLMAMMDSNPAPLFGGMEVVCQNCNKKTIFPTFCKTQEELNKATYGRLYTCKCGAESSIGGARLVI